MAMQTESRSDADDEDEAFLRRLVRPEEDRRRYTHAPYAGGFRWFRSPNVIPLERWRDKQQRRLTTPPKKTPPQAA